MTNGTARLLAAPRAAANAHILKSPRCRRVAFGLVSLPDVLRNLLTAAGPSGYETAPAAVFAEAGRRFTDDVEIDVMGSVVARVKGTDVDAPFLAVVGHIDEIGLIVTHIDDGGLLRFVGVAGGSADSSPQRVELTTATGDGRRSPGQPIHLLATRTEEGRRLRDCTSTSATKARRARRLVGSATGGVRRPVHAHERASRARWTPASGRSLARGRRLVAEAGARR